jgi:hypothetical protein
LDTNHHPWPETKQPQHSIRLSWMPYLWISQSLGFVSPSLHKSLKFSPDATCWTEMSSVEMFVQFDWNCTGDWFNNVQWMWSASRRMVQRITFWMENQTASTFHWAVVNGTSVM